MIGKKRILQALWALTITVITLLIVFTPKKEQLASETAFLLSSILCKINFTDYEECCSVIYDHCHNFEPLC